MLTPVSPRTFADVVLSSLPVPVPVVVGNIYRPPIQYTHDGLATTGPYSGHYNYTDGSQVGAPNSAAGVLIIVIIVIFSASVTMCAIRSDRHLQISRDRAYAERHAAITYVRNPFCLNCMCVSL